MHARFVPSRRDRTLCVDLAWSNLGRAIIHHNDATPVRCRWAGGLNWRVPN